MVKSKLKQIKSIIAERPKILILGILIFALLLFVSVYVYFYDRSSFLSEISLSVAANIIVLILVIFLIEKIKEISQKHEQRKWEKIALKQLKSPLVHHLGLLFKIFKASIQTNPGRTCTDIFEFFNENIEHLKYFDFSKPAPVFPERNWSEYLSGEFSKFKEALSRTIFKYALFLEPEMVELIEKIMDSSFMHFILQLPAALQFSRVYKNPSYNLLHSFLELEKVKKYLYLLKELIEKYDQLSIEEKISIPKFFWRDNVSPEWGNSRLS